MNIEYVKEYDWSHLQALICKYKTSSNEMYKSIVLKISREIFKTIKNKSSIEQFNQESLFILENLNSIDPRLSFKMLKCFQSSEKKTEELLKVSTALQSHGFFRKADKVYREGCKDYSNPPISKSTNEEQLKNYLSEFKTKSSFNSEELEKIDLISTLIDLENIPLSLKKNYYKIFLKLASIIEHQYPHLSQNLLIKIKISGFLTTIANVITELLAKKEINIQAKVLMRSDEGCKKIIEQLDLIFAFL